MANKDERPSVKMEHAAHYTGLSGGGKKPAIVQPPHLIESSNSSTQLSSNLTPLFDREETLKQPEISYNDASSSEESDYNQTSVIFSLDELQNSLTGLHSSVSPDIPSGEHKDSTGLLFPSLIQDEDEKFSVSSKEEEDERDQLNLGSTPPLAEDHLMNNRDGSSKTDIVNDIVTLNSEATTCSTPKANVEAQPNMTDDSLLCHVDSSTVTATIGSTTIDAVSSEVSSVPITAHPKSSLDIEDTSLADVVLDEHLNNESETSPADADTPSQVETSHVETSSDVATLTPADTPVANSNRSLSGMELLQTELNASVSSSSNPDNVFMHHDKPADSISTSGSIASGISTKSLSEKLKPTQNAFESPGLLYAHPLRKSKQITETLEPAEAATEALLTEKLPVACQKEHHHVRAKADKRGELFVDQTHLPSFNYKNHTGEV